jgi:hypothetical protein
MRLIDLVGALALGLGIRGFAQEAPPSSGSRVDFARDIEPVLKSTCLRCHGAEKPKGQLRLDVAALAMKGGVSGVAIRPGDSKGSLLLKLLLSPDPEERMPQKAPPLEKGKIDLIRRWIDEGAPWPEVAGEARVKKHWAYLKLSRPEVPSTRSPGWSRNPVDAFVRARLEKEGLAPSPEAAPETLLRRVTLDLIGLPPSPAQTQEFLSDRSPGAYEALVDRLLASPHYGERWARPWLDLARYADTNGFNFDTRRTMWRYRDWVIAALNSDMPFPEFTIEQLAGDLLPHATLEQRIATGFHRNTMTNEEGGVDPGEARWETLLDRVNTTAAVWLGTTLACAQCHNHKYDPFSQKDYYRFLAFFESSDEPRIELLTEEEKKERARLRGLLRTEETELRKLDLPAHIIKALDTPIEKRTNTNRNDLVIYCRAQAPPQIHGLTSRILELNRDLERLDGGTALVLSERAGSEPPWAYVRIKGGYTNLGEKVQAGVPASLHGFPESAPQNRLGLAQWLVSAENPLTARVVVNRQWAEFFGRPIVESPEDFGTQGIPPTHPELLDWLSTEWIRKGWSLKALHRTIVTSSTYRQSSRVFPELLERDPYNRLLARGPRFRMEAEMIRDVLLSASGLLSAKIGGPSVFPLQADTSGVVAINKVETAWTPSAGEDRYRRGLYTHWRRTAPFAAFMAFDAPSRECCTIRRARTNTPLQALTGLNDPAYFDAARGLARRLTREGAPGVRERVERGFELATGRKPRESERRILEGLYESERQRFLRDPRSARAVLRDSAVAPDEPETSELAAWTMVSSVLLNLDETITKE